jgi:hypothetical protein
MTFHIPKSELMETLGFYNQAKTIETGNHDKEWLDRRLRGK